MLQILIWAVCVVIFGIGYLGKCLEVLAAPPEKRTANTGNTFMILMFILSVILFVLSIIQAAEIQKLVG
ncbi:MAG: hypothetical protein AB1714_07325 [Acidobacteriota bacterium]